MQSSYETLGFELKQHVAVVTLPGFTDDHLQSERLADELAELCTEIEMQEEIRVVMVTDRAGKGVADTKQPIRNIPGLAASVAGLDLPIIATIHGDAIGQWLELAMACDIRIASDAARFGLPHIQAGIIPQNGGTQRLPRLIGKAKALEMILTGNLIDAREAERLHLVNKIVPAGDVMKAALEMAHDMAAKAPVALRFAKEGIYQGMDVTLSQGLRMEGDLYLLLYTTNDRVAGIEAFKNKTKPSFQGS